MEQTPLTSFQACPICGSPELQDSLSVPDHFLSKEAFVLKDCRGCGFRMTDPHPTLDSITKYYASEQYISHSNTSSSIQDRLYQLARNQALRNKLRLIRGYCPAGRILDMGCGTGEFLGYVKSRGYMVDGVEPALEPREMAIRNHSIPVVAQLSDIPAREQFDVVTLWHVLEHLHDLRDTLKRIFALLRTEGYLFIAVPDRESWDAQHYKEHWAAYDVPRHLYHFRRQDVDRLLDEHGLQKLAHKKMWMDAPYISMLSEKYRGKGGVGALIFGAALGLRSNLASSFGDRPTSSTLYVAQKRRI